jgi:hypothetical protein
VAALVVGSFAFGYLREIPTPSVLAADPAAPAADDPRIALWQAATELDSSLAASGGGFSFTATQLQVLRPVPGGQALLTAPDRDHPDASPTPVDQILLGSLSGRGAMRDGSFFAQWFNGTSADGSPNFDGDPAYQALVQDAGLWRRDATSDDDGLGWIAASDIPGFGVDPMSVAEWPEMLRRLSDVQDLGTDAEGHHWSGSIDPLWYPGAVAVDGASFTGSPIAVEVWLDASGRLATVFAIAQNINESTYAMLCIDRVSLDYTAPSVPTAPPSTP